MILSSAFASSGALDPSVVVNDLFAAGFGIFTGSVRQRRSTTKVGTTEGVGGPPLSASPPSLAPNLNGSFISQRFNYNCYRPGAVDHSRPAQPAPANPVKFVQICFRECSRSDGLI